MDARFFQSCHHGQTRVAALREGRTVPSASGSTTNIGVKRTKIVKIVTISVHETQLMLNMELWDNL